MAKAKKKVSARRARPARGRAKDLTPGARRNPRGGDSMSDMTQATQLRMQVMLDRQTKADAMASNVLKKVSDTASTIVGNLK